MSVFDDSSLSDFSDSEDTYDSTNDEIVPGAEDTNYLSDEPDFSTPVQSQTPNTFGSFFSQISQGIAGTLGQAIPQFTSQVLANGVNQISQLPGTYQGTTSGIPTTAQPTNSTSIFSTPTGWLLIGGIGLVAFLLFRGK